MTSLGLLISLGLVVLAVRRGLNLGHGLAGGCLVLGLTGSMSPKEMLAAVAEAVTDPKGVALIIVVGLLIALVQIQEAAGRWEALLARVQRAITSPRLSLAVFPALIGLLPLPGGSLFSAPMVDKLAGGLDLTKESKSLINYWFRHVWEYCWPLYPVMIFMSSLTHVPISRICLTAWPISLAAIGFGFLFVLRRIPPSHPSGSSLEGDGETAQGSPWPGLLPLLLVLAGALAGPWLLSLLGRTWPPLSNLPNQASMALALIGAVLLSGLTSGRSGMVLSAVLSRKTAGIVYLVAAVLSFKSMALASGAIPELGRAITDLGLPLWLVAPLLTFLVGMVTGYAPAYVATGFPVFVGLLPAKGLLGYLILGHVAGFAGVLLSPAHACLVVTNQYFLARSGPFYLRLLAPVLSTMAFGSALAALVLRAGW